MKSETRSLKFIDVLNRMVENPPSLVCRTFVVGSCRCGKPARFVNVDVSPKDIFGVDVVVSFLCENCVNGGKRH